MMTRHECSALMKSYFIVDKYQIIEFPEGDQVAGLRRNLAL